MIEVLAAILINHRQQILIAQRRKEKKQGLLWEFPGGKREPGETEVSALSRELHEELGIQLNPDTFKFFMFTDHEYDFGKIRLISYIGFYDGHTFQLTDHAQVQWVDLKDLANFELAPADRPLVNELTNQWTKLTAKRNR